MCNLGFASWTYSPDLPWGTAHCEPNPQDFNMDVFPDSQRNLRRDKDRRNMLQFNLQTLPKSAKQKERWGACAAGASDSSRTARALMSLGQGGRVVISPTIARNQKAFLKPVKPLFQPQCHPPGHQVSACVRQRAGAGNCLQRPCSPKGNKGRKEEAVEFPSWRSG